MKTTMAKKSDEEPHHTAQHSQPLHKTTFSVTEYNIKSIDQMLASSSRTKAAKAPAEGGG